MGFIADFLIGLSNTGKPFVPIQEASGCDKANYDQGGDGNEQFKSNKADENCGGFWYSWPVRKQVVYSFNNRNESNDYCKCREERADSQS